MIGTSKQILFLLVLRKRERKHDRKQQRISSPKTNPKVKAEQDINIVGHGKIIKGRVIECTNVGL